MSGRSTLYQGPGLGVVNPAFDPTLPRLQTLSMDRGSKSSIKGVDDDDIDDIAWDKNFDSGLVSQPFSALRSPSSFFTALQFRMVSMHSEKPICAPSHLSFFRVIAVNSFFRVIAVNSFFRVIAVIGYLWLLGWLDFVPPVELSVVLMICCSYIYIQLL